MLTKEEMRRKYQFLQILEELCEEQGKSKRETDEVTKDTKKEIRDALKWQAKRDAEEPEWRPWHGHDDMPYYRLEYDWVFTDDEVKEYREENWVHFHDPYGDGRDCTGVMFTAFLNVFPLPKAGKTVVYHVLEYDW